MARKNGDVDAERSKVKIFYAEAEGTSQSIQDLLRGLTAAMGSRPVYVQPKLVAANNGGAQAAAQPAATVANEPDLFTNAEEQANGEPAAEVVEQPARRKRGEGNGNRDRNSGLSIVKDLNLMPEGKDSLKTFVASKKPQNQMEHIAVYIFYLKTVLEEPKVGFSHILTCFGEVDETVPLDLPQSCRNAAFKKGWIDTADQDDLKTTTAGVNFVKQKLPAAAAAS